MRIRAARELRTSPLVSVVIPHHNYGRYLPTAVGSALGQGVPVEVIVVDDRSTDGSLDVARRIAGSDPRIALVEHDANQRHIRTYNDGLARATGEYVVLLSADDALAPGSLARSVALLESDPRIAMVYGRVERFVDEPAPTRAVRTWWSVWEGEEWIGRIAARGRNVPVNPEVIMRRAVYEDIGGYAPELPQTADMLMWLAAAARGRIARVNGPVQAHYRVHGANMHHRQFGGLLVETRAVRDTFERFFVTDGRLLRDAAGMRSRARASMARELALVSARLAHDDAGTAIRAGMLDLAREIVPGVDATAAGRWAGFAAGAGALTRKLTVNRVEALRWRVRDLVERELGV